ncbi:ADP-ribosylglycohydrolase family protein [Chlorogloeopsis sp. ULAP01]|uniref:ADP-ribosylglycohydrolase family protein n=1 Tax=Chlorogloeopsis sp. ULAP01 TaxID=3056483 RepID=UPI0025AABAAB|nr:ADP-ribosylglycohydrolase family protein [Chlorogloeopsis sp. ULAP01]MDM9382973.1 ADP-ribosylglycohydrolase family protein [Chlorogloeopsis sp. ULAP01]
MRYSLVNRVRGTFLGALVGESFAKASEKQSQIHLEQHHSQSLLDGGSNRDRSTFTRIRGVELSSGNWQKLALLGAESLIELGRFDFDDWVKRQQQAGIILEASALSSPEIILTTLPVALFCHENLIKLRQSLLDVVKIWDNHPLVQDWALVMGYAIAQSLTDKLTPLSLIPQAISFLGDTSTTVPQILFKLNNLLEKHTSLEKTQVEFNREDKLSYTMTMAFYCFLSTLEEFRLAILRVNQVNLHSPQMSAITGALSGTYNSTLGIPISWHFLFAKTCSAQWHLTNFSQMLQLADALIATWSGVYRPALEQSKTSEEKWARTSSAVLPQAIAAPRVIRLR